MTERVAPFNATERAGGSAKPNGPPPRNFRFDYRLLGGRAVVLFGILGVATIVVGTVLTILYMRALAQDDAEREMANLTRVLSEQTARAVQGVDLILLGTQARLQEGEKSGSLMEPKVVHSLLRARIDGIPQVRQLFVLAADGEIAYASSGFPAPRIGARDREYFRAHLDNASDALYFSRPAQDLLDSGRSFQMSRRLVGTGGDFRGVIAASVDVAHFRELYQSIKLPPGSAIALFRRDGALLLSEPDDGEAIAKTFGDLAIFRASAGGGVASGRVGAAANGTPQIGAYSAISGFPLVMSVAMDQSAALADWKRQALLISLGAAAIVLSFSAGIVALATVVRRDAMLTHALRDSEARVNGVIESAMDAVVTVDEAQRIVLFNPAAEKMFRCAASSVLGRPLDRLIPERYRAIHKQHIDRFAAARIASRAMSAELGLFALRADGQEFPIDASISRVETNGDVLFTAMVRDVTERRQAAIALEESHRRVRALAAALQSSREEEQRRLGVELHENLAQQVTALLIELAAIAPHLGENQSGVRGKLDRMQRSLLDTVHSIRRICAELRPRMLDNLGLAPALEWLVEGFADRTGIACNLTVDGAIDVDDAHNSAAFRIVEESLTNIERHAKAKRVDVRVALRDDAVAIEITDDGVGFDPRDTSPKSYGLLAMHERALALGGTFAIDSAPGKGTKVESTLPLDSACTT